jgi:hypothetical protein
MRKFYPDKITGPIYANHAIVYDTTHYDYTRSFNEITIYTDKFKFNRIFNCSQLNIIGLNNIKIRDKMITSVNIRNCKNISIGTQGSTLTVEFSIVFDAKFNYRTVSFINMNAVTFDINFVNVELTNCKFDNNIVAENLYLNNSEVSNYICKKELVLENYDSVDVANFSNLSRIINCKNVFSSRKIILKNSELEIRNCEIINLKNVYGKKIKVVDFTKVNLYWFINFSSFEFYYCNKVYLRKPIKRKIKINKLCSNCYFNFNLKNNTICDGRNKFINMIIHTHNVC